jgi:hypothetical protein
MDKTLRNSKRAKPPEVVNLDVRPQPSNKGAVSEHPVFTVPDSLAVAGGLVVLGALLGPDWGAILGVIMAIPAILIIAIKAWYRLVDIAKTEVAYEKGPWG